MATEVSINDLSTWLSNQPANTADTPYELEITGLTISDFPSGGINCRIESILRLSGRYVDLSKTVIPEGVEDLSGCFYTYDTSEMLIIYAPKLPSTAKNMYMAFEGQRNLKEPPVIPDGVTNMFQAFYDCEALEYKPIVPSSVTDSTDCFYDVTATEWRGTKSQAEAFVDSTNVWAYAIDPDTLEIETVVVDISYLNTWVNAQPVNTVYTPYEVIVAGLTTSNYTNLNSKLRACTRFVGLSETSIPNGVTSINNLFDECPRLVTPPLIPNTVTQMGYTFCNCAWLKYAPEIPSSVYNMQGTFLNCSRRLKEAPLIPDAVTDFQYTFQDCSSLEKPPILGTRVQGVTKAFENCTSLLYKPIIPSSVRSGYDTDVFKNVTATDWIGTESQVTYFNPNCQDDCKIEVYNDDRVTLEDTIHNVDISTLSTYLAGLAPNTVPSAYKIYIRGLTSSNVMNIKTALAANSTKYVDLEYTTITVAVAGTYPPRLFQMCTSLVGSPVFGEGITDLDMIFYQCTNLRRLQPFPSSLTMMQAVFGNCTSLENPPVIPPNVTSLNNLFTNCTSLQSAPVIPSSVTDMTATFRNCTSLRMPPVIPANVTVMDFTFSGCYSLEECPVIPNGVTRLNETFYYCRKIKTPPQIPSTVTFMEGCFLGCTSLEEAPEIPSGVTSLKEVFKGCSNLETFSNIPNGVTKLTNAFNGCVKARRIANQKTSPAVSIWNAQGDSNTPYHSTTMKNGWSDSVDNSYDGDTFVSRGIPIPSDVQSVETSVLYKDPNHDYGFWGYYPLKILRNQDTGKLYLWQYTRETYQWTLNSNAIIELSDIGINSNGSIDFSNYTVIKNDYRECIYTDSTKTTTKSTLGGDNIGDTAYLYLDSNELSGTYETLSDAVVLRSNDGIDYTVGNELIIPSTVTEANNAFYNCAMLDKIKELHIPLATLKDNPDFQDMFKNCTSLIQIGFKVNAGKWHAWRLKFDGSSVEGKIFGIEKGQIISTAIQNTQITQNDIKLPVLTDELWFPDSIMIDSEVEDVIEDVLNNRYTYWKKPVIDPSSKSLVMMASDPDNVVSNFLGSSTPQQTFNIVHPVGEIYIQYPQQKDPEDLYNHNGITSTWTLQTQYAGAFFRSSGGNADTFIEEGNALNKQAGQNLAHNHKLNDGNTSSSGTVKTAGFRGVSGTVSVSGGNHRHQVPAKRYTGGGSGSGYHADTVVDLYSEYSGNLSMSGNFTPTGYLYGNTDNSGGNENRPDNYTINVWKRTA